MYLAAIEEAKECETVHWPQLTFCSGSRISFHTDVVELAEDATYIQQNTRPFSLYLKVLSVFTVCNQFFCKASCNFAREKSKAMTGDVAGKLDVKVPPFWSK